MRMMPKPPPYRPLISSVPALSRPVAQLCQPFTKSRGRRLFRQPPPACVQLAFLEVLAQRQPIEHQVVKFCYELHRKRCFERGMICDSFDEWAAYLITSGLIEADQGAYTLTESGRNFILHFAPANSLNMKTRIL